jgi:hypothetical protein
MGRKKKKKNLMDISRGVEDLSGRLEGRRTAAGYPSRFLVKESTSHLSFQQGRCWLPSA